MKSSRPVRFGPLLASLGFILLTGLVWFKHQSIYDWWRLRQYQPSGVVVQLATDTTMNDATRRLFYVYRPELQDRAAFNRSCAGSEKTIVLGCYVSRHGIYLFDVTDERLEGIEQVTAAHEILHAAYDRLSAKDRIWVDALTSAAYSAVTDTRVRQTVEAYRAKDPSVVPNELHSILATEVASLPVELENYYKRYFMDRSAIIRLSQKYEQEFAGRQQRVEAADKTLQQLKAQIEALEKTLNNQVKSINNEYDRLQKLRQSNQVEAYNAGVTGYNAQVSAYNANVRRQQAMISQYNALVAERNALAVEENELLKAIDSRPQTIEAQ